MRTGWCPEPPRVRRPVASSRHKEAQSSRRGLGGIGQPALIEPQRPRRPPVQRSRCRVTDASPRSPSLSVCTGGRASELDFAPIVHIYFVVRYIVPAQNRTSKREDQYTDDRPREPPHFLNWPRPRPPLPVNLNRSLIFATTSRAPGHHRIRADRARMNPARTERSIEFHIAKYDWKSGAVFGGALNGTLSGAESTLLAKHGVPDHGGLWHASARWRTGSGRQGPGRPNERIALCDRRLFALSGRPRAALGRGVAPMRAARSGFMWAGGLLTWASGIPA